MKRMIAYLLTFIMLFTAIPQTVHATNSNTPTMTMDGYTYKIDTEKQTATIVKYTGDATVLTIPESFEGYPVTVIGKEAFFKCQSLETVILPDSVEDIGYRAFAQCPNLHNVNFPLNWTKTSGMNNSGNVFYKCPKLTSLVVPEGVTAIPSYAFAGTTALTEITLPSTLTIIKDSAFSNCTALTSLQIPSSVTEIKTKAFQGCTSLTDLQLSEGLLSIGKQAFYKCTSLETVILPDSVKAIGTKAFGECTNLSNINFPLNWSHDAGLDENGIVFFQCKNLTEMHVPEGVTKLPVGAFSSAANLINITLPQTLEKIYDSAFSGCKALPHISIPDTVTSIGQSAFSNCDSLTDVYLPTSLEILEMYAFSDCDNLRYVTVPNKNTVFERDVFKKTENVILICPLHSMATVYAIDNDMEFACDSFQTDTTGEVLIRDNSLYQAAISSIYTNGYITFSLDYEIQEDTFADLVFPEIIIRIPEGTALIEETILEDNVISTTYKYNEQKQTLAFDLTKASGNITFSTKAYELRDIQSYAYLEYRENYEPVREVIGVISESMELLSLNVEDVTSLKELPVDGIAPASSVVEFYLNGTPVGTAVTNKVGAYQAIIPLNPTGDFDVFTLEARTISADSQPLSVSRTLTYRTAAPELLGFQMYYDFNKNRVYDLYGLNKEGLRPIISGTSALHPATYVVTMSHPSAIETVYVTSTRNNVKKSMLATFDEATGTFVAEGYFDESDRGYLPGKLRVEYTLKPQNTSLLSPDGTLKPEILEAYYTDAYHEKTTTTTTATENGISGTINLTELLQGTEGLTLSSDDYDRNGLIEVGNISEFRDVILQFTYESLETDESTVSGIDVIERVYSYLVPCEDGKTYRLTVDCNDPDSWILTLAELATDGVSIVGDITKMKFNAEYEDFIHKGKAYPADLATVSNALDQYSTVADILTSSFRIVSEYHDLCNEINTSSVMIHNPEQKARALKATEELRDDRLMLVLLTTVLPAIATGGTSSVTGALLTVFVGAMASTSDFFYASRNCGIAQYQSGGFPIIWVIDPSGYVYDAITEERLEGVTTTVYCIEYDETDTFWDNKPAEDTYGTMWNALEYSQQNPLITDHEGRYAWDVPEGWWRVKYEKDGYETTWSEWLPVPPPQTEVNIGMMPLEMPGTPKPDAEPVATAEPTTSTMPDTEPMVSAEPESATAAPEATDSVLPSSRGKAANRGNLPKHN